MAKPHPEERRYLYRFHPRHEILMPLHEIFKTSKKQKTRRTKRLKKKTIQQTTKEMRRLKKRAVKIKRKKRKKTAKKKMIKRVKAKKLKRRMIKKRLKKKRRKTRKNKMIVPPSRKRQGYVLNFVNPLKRAICKAFISTARFIGLKKQKCSLGIHA